MRTNHQAFTLIELLTVIAIVMIIFGYAIPSFADLIGKSKVDANVSRLAQVIQLSRSVAITNNTKVTMCPINEKLSCSSNWSNGYMSFVDSNGNRKFEAGEELLFQYFSQEPKSKVSWRAFGHRRSLQWLGTGITNHQNGSFELCYADKQKLYRAIFITKTGRIRYSKDNNNDGYHENSKGALITC